MAVLLRVWKEFNLKEVEKKLIIVGELSSECFSCHKIGIDLKTKKCPGCGIEFKYMGCRRKITMNFLKNIKEEFPQLILIDFDDFKKALSKRDARNLLNI